MRRCCLLAVCVAFCLFYTLSATVSQAEAIIADHVAVAAFDEIPLSVVEDIGTNYNIYYVHTSHGSQIMTGIDMLYDEDNNYDPPTFYERSDDLGHVGDTSWVAHTRTYLDNTPACNMAMFSWCGGCSDNTEAGISIYLAKMEDLEADYPAVTFIYMTGHLDGGGVAGNLYARNNQIRAYCVANDKILFDFADIESWDPDGNYYPDESDGCAWCSDWCAIYTCPTCGGCAHSHCFNCYLKGKGWWWMMARISGWNSATAPEVDSTSPDQNALNVVAGTAIDVYFSMAMDVASLSDSTIVVHGSLTGLHSGTVTYDAVDDFAHFVPDVPFAVGEVATVTVTTDVEGGGEALDTPYIWSFTCIAGAGVAEFPEHTSYAVGTYPTSVRSADLDGDGDFDLVTVSQDGVSVNLNQGDGSFASATTYSAGSWPYDAALGDFDLDGDIDIYATGLASEYFHLATLLLNNGDGTFVSGGSANGGGDGRSVAADLDGDGDLDVATAGTFWSEVTVTFNNGDSTFTYGIQYPVGQGARGLDAVDLDGDADLDLVVGNAYGNSITVLLNNGAGDFSDTTTYQTYFDPWGLDAADMNEDGIIDVITSVETSEYMGYTGYHEGVGDGTMGLTGSFYMGAGGCWSTVAADVNGDGHLDAIHAASDNYANLRLGNGDGTFQGFQLWITGSNPRGIAAADFNGDGVLDLATADQNDNTVSVLLNMPHDGPVWWVVAWGDDVTGDGSESYPFATIQHGIDVATTGDTVMIKAGTFTGDGNRDLDFGGKNLVVMSEDGRAAVVIDCEGTTEDPHRGFSFHSGEDSTSVLYDLTVINAYSDSGAIFVTNATPTIRRCEIINNTSYGIMCEPDWPWPDVMLIDSCVISDNSKHGIKSWNASLVITHSRIEANDSDGVHIDWSGQCEIHNSTIALNGGTGFWAFTLGQDFLLENCTFVMNRRGMFWDANYPKDGGEATSPDIHDSLVIHNCVFAFNLEQGIEYGWAPWNEAGARCTDSYGNLVSNWENVPWFDGDTLGNISADPLFCDTGSGDYSLSSASPCTPAGNSCGVYMGAGEVGCDGTCCVGIRGNINGDAGEAINIADLTYLVAYLFNDGATPSCFEEADVDGSLVINIADVTFVVAYLFGGGASPGECP